jgi:hypothetical protein
LVSDHLHGLPTVYDERFAHGVAGIRCDDGAHESLLAFSCKCRFLCSSCRAKRLASWTQWLDTTLLAPVPHRQGVLTMPMRLRASRLYRRRLLGEIARVAACTVTAAIRTLTGERDLAVGIVLRLGAGGRSPFATRLAQCCARNPVALERLMHGRTAKAVTYRSDKSDGVTAGTATVDPLVELPDSRGESGDRLTHRHDVDRACGPP